MKSYAYLPFYTVTAKPKNNVFRGKLSTVLFLASFLIISVTLWTCSSSTFQSKRTLHRMEIMDTSSLNGVLVGSESLESDQSFLATEIETDSRLGWQIKGFSVISTTSSAYIYPDLDRQMEFKTSQLAIVNSKVYPSRKVLYRSYAKPKVVVVTALDASWSPEILKRILDERKQYCEKNGYGLFVRYAQDFAAENRPLRESLAMASIKLLRQAFLSFPNSEYFWYFGPLGHIESFQTPMRDLMNQKGNFLKFVQDNVHMDVNMKFSSTNDKLGDIIISVDPDYPDTISPNSIIIKQSVPAKALLELLADVVIQNYPKFIDSRDHCGKAITHLLQRHPALAQNVVTVSPEWSGNRPCSYPYVTQMTCTFGSQYDWLNLPSN